MLIWATFEIRFVAKNFKNLPNLVTLQQVVTSNINGCLVKADGSVGTILILSLSCKLKQQISVASITHRKWQHELGR